MLQWGNRDAIGILISKESDGQNLRLSKGFSETKVM
jgi:hypothetical protein